MAVTYRELRIAKSCAKILLCFSLFGSSLLLKHWTHDRRVDGDIRTDLTDNGKLLLSPEDGIYTETNGESCFWCVFFFKLFPIKMHFLLK